MLRSLIDSAVRRAYKAQNFDYVTFSGRFNVRKIDGLMSHSGFMCFDIDHIDSEVRLQEIKSLLVNDSLLPPVLLFRSPSGNGLKWIVEVPDKHWLTQCQQRTVNGQQSYIDIITQNHRTLYERIREYLLQEYEIGCDATSDVARPCYLCYDPDAYYDEPTFRDNPAHKLLTSFVSIVGTQRAVSYRSQDRNESIDYRPLSADYKLNNWDTTDHLIRRIESRAVDITGDYLDWVRLGFAFANTFGESGRGFYHRVSQFHPHYDSNQTNRQYDNCLKTNRGLITLGTAIHQLTN